MTSKKNRLSYSFLMTCNIFVILKVYPGFSTREFKVVKLFRKVYKAHKTGNNNNKQKIRNT